MPRIFKVPFAAQGDKDVVPEATQGDGSVSITQGFGFDYEREYEDPASKDIRREVMNGLLHDLSEAIGDIQLSGVAKWSKDAAPYPEGALVWHNNQAWLSLVGNNSVTPTLGSSWTSQADPRLFLALANNLSDLPNPATARTNLGLGNSATRDVGTGSGQVAAGNDSRITGAAQKSANLSDLSNTSTARNNLGLGSAATVDMGTAGAQLRTNAENDSRYANISVSISAGSGLSGGGNLSANRTLAVDGTVARLGTGGGQVRTNTQNDARFLQIGNNLSEVNASASRDNLGLGTMATRMSGTASTSFRNNEQNDGRFVRLTTHQEISGNKDFQDTVSMNQLIVTDMGSQVSREGIRMQRGAAEFVMHMSSSRLHINPAGAAGDGIIMFPDGSVRFGNGVSGDGGGLSNLNAGNVSSGTLADARIPSSIVRTSRTITAGTGLSGGGNLSSDRTISISNGGVGTSQLESGERMTTANVLSAIASASAGGFGTYAFLFRESGTTGTNNSTAGSGLRYSGAGLESGGGAGDNPPGTWRCFGITTTSARSSVFLRVV